MPVHDIQEKTPRLIRIGVIRLGEKKTNKEGKEYPVESPHFVLTDAPELKALYGESPTELLIYLPFPSVDDNLPAHHELWARTACRCRGDGRRIIDLLEPSDWVHRVIRDGEVVQAYSDNGQAYEVGEVVPCPGLDHDLYARCSDCRPIARLIVMVRDPNRPTQLANDRWGYYQISTSSYLNIRQLTGQLQGLENNTRQMGKDLTGIPLVLRRVPREISYIDEKANKRSKTTKHFLELEVDPAWVRAASEAIYRLATGGLDVPALPELIDQDTGEIIDMEPEPEVVEEKQEVLEPPDVPKGVVMVKAKRPYKADTLRQLVGLTVKGYLKEDPDLAELLSEEQAQAFAKDFKRLGYKDEERYCIVQYLINKRHSAELTYAEAATLRDWFEDGIQWARREADDVLAAFAAEQV